MEFLGVKWLWLYAGVILMLLEILAPGFVIFFFGLAAATVGGVMFIVPELSATWQAALFTVFSIAYLCGLRKFMKSVFMGDTAETKRIASEYVGRLGTVIQAITPVVPGRILLGDAEWEARADIDIAKDARVRVVAQENLTLVVEPI